MPDQSERIHVDPGTLHAGGAKVAAAADTAGEAFTTHHRRMEDAMVGWSPAARAAMGQLLDRWNETHARLTTAVTTHGESLQAAAREYSAQDAANASAVRTSGVGLD